MGVARQLRFVLSEAVLVLVIEAFDSQRLGGSIHDYEREHEHET